MDRQSWPESSPSFRPLFDVKQLSCGLDEAGQLSWLQEPHFNISIWMRHRTMGCVVSGAVWRGYSESSSEVGFSNAPHAWTHVWAECPARYRGRLRCCSRTLAALLSLTENLHYFKIFLSTDWPHTAVPTWEPDVNCL